ncbi:hypothetical protein IAR55_003158 [Kwoniella newhampshirensis]|uniref:NAD-dependent epimerase/dehydratase domain-containing protein n=1 Tax=Kwoniella newhampshirensis TaxID=1651941 RepID=A0AAW0Z0R8_9TREE
MSAPIVAITGLNGFIATHLAVLYLSKGWRVRASARTVDKVERLKSQAVFEDWVAKDLLEVIVVEDMTNVEQIKTLLDGVEAVAHLAAPVDQSLKSWDAFKIPTVKGVTTILEAAKDSPTIKAVTIMSSSAAALNVIGLAEQRHTYVETDWYPFDEATCASFDPEDKFSPQLWYCGAKKYAELAAYEFVETHKPKWSMATFCPAMVYGPTIQFANPQDFNDATPGNSIADFIALVGGKDEPLPMQRGNAYADVRDTATAMFNAVVGQKSGRFFICGHDYTFQMLANMCRKLRPDLDAYFPLGDPTLPDIKAEDIPHLSNVKSIEELGVKYHSMEETLKDSLAYWEKIGVFKIPPGSWKA